MNIIDLIGQKYNQLTITSVSVIDRKVVALCDCGNIKEYRVYNILNGHTKSCGCLAVKLITERKTTHGKSCHPLYILWAGIIKRCENVKCKAYHNYGGRGIAMSIEWRNDFVNFYDWALINGWRKGLEIDRVDNNGNYSAGNCRFVTRLVNANNKRSNRVITFNGETKTLSQFARQFNLNNLVLNTRVRNGWNMHDALNYPVKKKGGNNNRYIMSVRHTFGYIT